MEVAQLVDFSDLSAVMAFIISLSLVVFLRYVFVSGLFVGLFYIIFKDKFLSRKISEMLRPKGQSWQEIRWSALTSFIFALSGVGIVWMWQSGHSTIYIDPYKYSIFYLSLIHI